MPSLLRLSLLIVTGFILHSITAYGQKIQDSTAYNISLQVANFSYFRNYEYYNDLQKGYTLFGHTLTPVLSFNNHKSPLALEAGAFIQQDFGNTSLQRVRPAIALTARKIYYVKSIDITRPIFKKEWSFRMGTLYNQDYHLLPEVLYNRDQLVFNPLEYGIQFRYRNPFIETDQWLHWQRMIYNNSTGNEHFQVGISAISRTTSDSSKNHITIPIHCLIQHSGGQIGQPDTSDSEGTTINLNSGLYFNKYFNSSCIQSMRFGFQYALSNTNQQQLPDVPQIGRGIEFSATITFLKRFYGTISYWQARDFYAPYGRFITQSRSSAFTDTYTYIPERQLMFVKLNYVYQLGNFLKINLEAEPYYDMQASLFEYAYHLTIHYQFLSRLYRQKN